MSVARAPCACMICLNTFQKKKKKKKKKRRVLVFDCWIYPAPGEPYSEEVASSKTLALGDTRTMDRNSLNGDVLFAVPKKGRVYETIVEILKETGLEYSRSPRLDFAKCKTFPNTTILFLPCKDIPQYLDRGNVDIGITGEDMIAESNADIAKELELGFGKCRLCVLGPKGKFRSVRELHGKTVGTSFPVMAKRFFKSQGIDVQIQKISGSVEIACPLGLADAVVDLVETGTTMRAAGLEIVDTIMPTQMVLASNKHSRHREVIAQIVRRIEGYSIARDWVLLSYNLPKYLVAQASIITPGMDGPSVVSLDHEDMVALSAMVRRKGSANKIDELSQLGATGIFVTELKHYRPGLKCQSASRAQPLKVSTKKANADAAPSNVEAVSPLQDPSRFTSSPSARGSSSGGGQSSIAFGTNQASATPDRRHGQAPSSQASTSPNHHSRSHVVFGDAHGSSRNTPRSMAQEASMSSNAFASGSNQNAGNVITKRPSTRVHAPPGGKSSFLFG